MLALPLGQYIHYLRRDAHHRGSQAGPEHKHNSMCTVRPGDPPNQTTYTMGGAFVDVLGGCWTNDAADTEGRMGMPGGVQHDFCISAAAPHVGGCREMQGPESRAGGDRCLIPCTAGRWTDHRKETRRDENCVHSTRCTRTYVFTDSARWAETPALYSGVERRLYRASC